MSSPARLFGTDGVRGAFGEPPLDQSTVVRLAGALGATLRLDKGETAPPLIVLGGDTRESTPQIATWLASGLAAEGIRVAHAGILPTPGVAFLTRELDAAAGIVISASHNPYPDNGIKIFGADGFKLAREEEERLEEAVASMSRSLPQSSSNEAPVPVDPTLRERYLDALVGSCDSTPEGLRPLDGLEFVLDLGNGAAVSTARSCFERLGAKVLVLSDAPDGRNVNDGCGSTEPALMAQAVRSSAAVAGFAFDGDADRVIVCDERGDVRDGDAILYLLATHLAALGELTPPSIVATSMSNLGLEVALGKHGIELVRCDVGDRVVADTLRAHRLRLGGEQSGHIIDLERATTGDGVATALMIARILAESTSTLSSLLTGIRRFPQVLENVRVTSKPDLRTLPELIPVIERVEDDLGETGRLVLRYSGTESLARVMIEGESVEQITELSAQLIDAIRTTIGDEAADEAS